MKWGAGPREGEPPHKIVTTALDSPLLAIPPVFFPLSLSLCHAQRLSGWECVCVNVFVCMCAARWKFHKNVFYTYKLVRMGEYALK